MRDLLSVLDIERVTVVGHSLGGGGVAMQFAYQFPQLIDRLVPVGAGGVTRDVNIALRLAALQLGTEALALLRIPLVLPALLQLAGRLGGHCPGRPGLATTCSTCCGFSTTCPSPRPHPPSPGPCVRWPTGGQVVTMLDRCYLTGSHSGAIGLGHPRCGHPGHPWRTAHAAMPGSRARVLRPLWTFPVSRRPRPVRETHRGIHRHDCAVGLRPRRPARTLQTGVTAKSIDAPHDTKLAVPRRWRPTNAARPSRRQPDDVTPRCARSASISRSKSSADENERYTEANRR